MSCAQRRETSMRCQKVRSGLRGCEALERRRLFSTYFVSPSGSDAADGSNATPWQTLQHAAGIAVAGDVVDVRPGAYAGFVMGWDGPQAGTAAAPITYHAEPGAVINS